MIAERPGRRPSASLDPIVKDRMEMASRIVTAQKVKQ